MALKYQITLDNYEICILDSEWSGSSMEISPNVIQAINFDIEGENNDITAPIIKTSLSMTFVDAPDLPESGTMKCGNWEEFYTPDARRWQVNILQDGDVVWSGFITPDSYTEELRYRGSVTLIARDGIGMLDDIMFDAEGNEAGMITPQEIINKAVDLIDTHMYVSFGEGEADAWLQTAGGTMGYDTYIPVAAFKDKSWYEALEGVLTAYGACMRFINGHTWAVVSLRFLPKLRQLSWYGSDKTETPLFSAYATREMVPAVRSIHEVVDYETGDGKPLPMADAFSFTGEVESYNYTTYNGGVTVIQAPIHPITSNNVWSGNMFFNPNMYGYDKVANGVSENAIFIPMFEYQHASSGLNKAIFTYPLSKTSGVLKMSIGTPHVLINGEFKTAPQELMPTPQFTLVVQLLSDDGTYYYYNGETFVTTYTEYKCMPKDGLIEIPLSLDGLSGNSYTLNVMFYYIGVAGVTAYEYYQGMYACINSMSLERIGTQSYLSTNRVNTIYSESNNVKIDRNPVIGPAFNNAIVPSIIRNAIFDISNGAYVPAPSWTWEAGGSSQQLAVYNHLSIIPYYARPHNLLQGTILRESKIIEPNIIWEWNGQKHLLLSGSFDLLSGRINRAVLHEYDTYDELWGYESSTIPTVSASTDFSDSTNSGGSSSGGSGGGGGTSVTIDSAMSDTSANAVQNKVIKAYVDDRVDSIEVSGVVVDTAISESSTNPVQNKVIKSYIDSSNTAHTAALQSYVNTQIITVKGLIPSVDSSISSTSTNPVQNKIVKSYIDAQDVNVKNEQALALSNLNTQLKAYTDSAVRSLVIPVVDSAISSTSTNAIQNKVVKAYVDEQNSTQDTNHATVIENTKTELKSYTDSAIASLDIPAEVKVDSSISSSSTNPVQNKIVKAYVDEQNMVQSTLQANMLENAKTELKTYTDNAILALDIPAEVIVDSTISSTSTNPVQNKVVKAYIDSQNDSQNTTHAQAIENARASMKTYTDNAIAALDIPEDLTIDTAMSATSTNAVQNKVIKVYVDGELSELSTSLTERMNDEVVALESSIAAIGKVGRSAGPKMKMVIGSRNLSHQLIWEHEWSDVDGVELVLMHYNRNAKKKISDGVYGDSKAWRMAHGRKLTFTSTSHHILLSDFKDYITKAWIEAYYDSVSKYSDEYMIGLTYDEFVTAQWHKCIFRNNKKKSKLFGWAVRYPNPAFWANVSPTAELSDATTSIMGEPRYIYSDVTPMRLFVHTPNDETHIGLRFTE